ncbi:MAG: SHOCT domain-containing protein [Mariprofundaceae bacterium]|nr:SHOCT domain-containing protein [Mariprofundaceae bacterium]
MIKYSILAFTLLLMSACTTHAPVHQPVSELEQRIVKDMHILDNQSRVIFFLGESIGAINVGSRIPMDIFIDGKFIGNLGRRSDMVVADLTPGKHTLLANGMPEFSPETKYLTKPMNVNLIAGKQSFYRVTLKSTTESSQKLFGMLSPSDAYTVSLKIDKSGSDDLSNHTVVVLYSDPLSEQVTEPVRNPIHKTSNKPEVISNDIVVKMTKIKEMHEKGLITQSEYDSKRKELLESY